MIGAAVAAGRAALAVYRGEFAVERKADGSPVTAADHAAQAIILQRLGQAARVPVIAEEEVAAGRVPAIGHEFFLVDPLDGTKEFIQRRGEFTVNIALIRAGAPVLGVVYAPVNASLYCGNVEATSAFRSTQRTDSDEPSARQPIRVRPVPASGLTAVVSRSHATPETDAYLAHYTVAHRVSIGSSLKFCLVAAGGGRPPSPLGPPTGMGHPARDAGRPAPRG